MFRVVSGALKADSTVHNKTQGRARSGSATCMLLQGKTQTNVPEIKAGDLGAVAKLKDTLTNDTLGDKADRDHLPADQVSRAGARRTRSSRRAAATRTRSAPSMHRLEEEDPVDPLQPRSADQGAAALRPGAAAHRGHGREAEAALRRRRQPEAAAHSRTARRSRRRPRRTAATRSRPAATASSATARSRSSRCARGADFEFVDDIFGGSIPRQFVPAVEKGIQDARTRGYLAGYPMVDFRVTVFDGSYHDVDSNELSFKLAGSLAFKDAMTRARPTILEPIMNVEVYAPSDFAGDLMGDLNGRRGRIGGMDTRGATTIIKAQVPMSEMLTYEQHLTSATGGRGSYHMEYSHYDEVPAHLQTKIIAAAKAERAGVEVEEV